MSTRKFEAWADTQHRVTISHYHADNGIFADNKEFRQALRDDRQTLSFCTSAPTPINPLGKCHPMASGNWLLLLFEATMILHPNDTLAPTTISGRLLHGTSATGCLLFHQGQLRQLHDAAFADTPAHQPLPTNPQPLSPQPLSPHSLSLTPRYNTAAQCPNRSWPSAINQDNLQSATSHSHTSSQPTRPQAALTSHQPPPPPSYKMPHQPTLAAWHPSPFRPPTSASDPSITTHYVAIDLTIPPAPPSVPSLLSSAATAPSPHPLPAAHDST